MSFSLVVGGTAMALAIAASSLRIDREYQRGVIFRLGRSAGVRGPGLYFVIPAIEQKVQVDVRTRTVNIEPQETVTADSVTIRVNAVLYYRILAPEKAINKVESYEMAVYQAAMTTLRNVVGQNNLDEVLQSRDAINARLQEIVDEITEPWGIVIERVEMKDVEIPTSMQRAMAKEAEALREKRARLIKAAAEQEASVKLSEASRNISENPAALELRRLQMLTEVGAENNTTTIVMIPSELLNMAARLGAVPAPSAPAQSFPMQTMGQTPARTAIASANGVDAAPGDLPAVRSSAPDSGIAEFPLKSLT
jgi:regulator of protease activity HflC (stomatin/prohibitin superfamily)